MELNLNSFSYLMKSKFILSIFFQRWFPNKISKSIMKEKTELSWIYPISPAFIFPISIPFSLQTLSPILFQHYEDSHVGTCVLEKSIKKKYNETFSFLATFFSRVDFFLGKKNSSPNHRDDVSGSILSGWGDLFI